MTTGQKKYEKEKKCNLLTMGYCHVSCHGYDWRGKFKSFEWILKSKMNI